MEIEIQKIIYNVLIGFIIIHAFLIFLEALKVGPTQHNGLLDLKIIRIGNKMRFLKVLKAMQKDDNGTIYTVESIIRGHWCLKLLRVLGFVPLLVLGTMVSIYGFKDIFNSELPYAKVNQILLYCLFIIEFLFISIKIYYKVPDVLIALHPDYHDKTYLKVLFSIFPFWK